MVQLESGLEDLGVTCPYAVLVVPDAVRRDRRVVATASLIPSSSAQRRNSTYLTCSETNCVVPAASSHLPRKSSPRNGFNGFFSLPSFSFLLLYCCLRVLRNHLSTSRARLAGSGSDAGATNSDGCSVQ